MESLGNFFPHEVKKKFAINNLKPGSIFRLLVPDTTPPKEKFLILVGVESNNLLFASIFINSEINPNIFNSELLKSLHYQLKVENYSFLKRNSYADCSKITERKSEELMLILENNTQTFVETLNEIDFGNIKSILKSSTTINVVLKKKYGFI
ncbi:MAG: hypothetical protein EAZ27_01130 [Cytophagales bacterium]|nr:MAG: hypothetical protein EAZ27_01130 [Cytophagales bacterium]